MSLSAALKAREERKMSATNNKDLTVSNPEEARIFGAWMYQANRFDPAALRAESQVRRGELTAREAIAQLEN